MKMDFYLFIIILEIQRNVDIILYRNNLEMKIDPRQPYLSSSSAWSIGSIALRAAYFSSLRALELKSPQNYDQE